MCGRAQFVWDLIAVHFDLPLAACLGTSVTITNTQRLKTRKSKIMNSLELKGRYYSVIPNSPSCPIHLYPPFHYYDLNTWMQSSKGNSYAYVEVSRYHPRSKTGIKDPVPTKEIKLYEVMPRSRTNHRVTDYIFVVFLILIQRNVSQSNKVSQFIFWPRHARLTLDYYRPQGKVMSLEACVSHSVHRGGRVDGDPPLDRDTFLWTETPFSDRDTALDRDPLTDIYWQPLQRSVRILLECISVFHVFMLYRTLWVCFLFLRVVIFTALGFTNLFILVMHCLHVNVTVVLFIKSIHHVITYWFNILKMCGMYIFRT